MGEEKDGWGGRLVEVERETGEEKKKKRVGREEKASRQGWGLFLEGRQG